MKKIVLLGVVSLLIGLSGCGKKEPTEKELNMHREMMAQESVKKILKDPDSAKFQNMNGLCGEVNSKNSFGGYTGYSEFVAATNPLPHSKERVIFIESGIKKYLSSHDVIAAGCDAWWNSGYSLTYCIEEPTSTNRKICRVLE